MDSESNVSFPFPYPFFSRNLSHHREEAFVLYHPSRPVRTPLSSIMQTSILPLSFSSLRISIKHSRWLWHCSLAWYTSYKRDEEKSKSNRSAAGSTLARTNTSSPSSFLLTQRLQLQCYQLVDPMRWRMKIGWTVRRGLLRKGEARGGLIGMSQAGGWETYRFLWTKSTPIVYGVDRGQTRFRSLVYWSS